MEGKCLLNSEMPQYGQIVNMVSMDQSGSSFNSASGGDFGFTSAAHQGQ